MNRVPNNQSGDRALRRKSISSGTDRKPTLIAVDLGAESCRVSLLRWVDGQPHILLVHRFQNSILREGASLKWDWRKICAGVEDGLRMCATLAPKGLDAIGVDGWAVDYVRLGANGIPPANPFCYRDERTTNAMAEVHARISAERLYALTGVQILSLNTLYQLYADSNNGVPQSARWLNLPEFVLHRLGGKQVSEYSNATHTQLLSFDSRNWCPEIFTAADLDLNAAPPVVPPGTEIGRVAGPLASLPAFHNTKLVAPACHDTASAIAGIPAVGGDWAFISSGTWSLVGCVLDSACVSETARQSNFSNEGGIGGRINFLKNVNGMWLLQRCIQHWKTQGREWSLQDLLAECAPLKCPDCLLDVDDPDLLLPDNMPQRINTQLKSSGCAPISEDPDKAAEMANLIFHSLAVRYAAVLSDLERITRRRFRNIYVVGGGSRNTFLNGLIEKKTGISVLTGSSESSTVGNFAIQLATLNGQYDSETGTTAAAVAKWANILASLPVEATAQIQIASSD